jgi:putative acetyltransferase
MRLLYNARSGTGNRGLRTVLECLSERIPKSCGKKEGLSTMTRPLQNCMAGPHIHPDESSPEDGDGRSKPTKEQSVASFDIRKLEPQDADAVAHVLRASFDDRLPWLAGRYTPDEDRQFVREQLFPACEVWGAFAPDLVGIIALQPNWLDQLYVLPERQGDGIGTALLALAKKAYAELTLWTFQRNASARRFYERNGFVALEETDGQRNEEREPDVLYRWTAAGAAA